MRTLGILRHRYEQYRNDVMKKKKGDYQAVREALRGDLVAYFETPEGKENLALSFHAGKDVSAVVEDILKTVDGWEKTEVRFEAEKPAIKVFPFDENKFVKPEVKSVNISKRT